MHIGGGETKLAIIATFGPPCDWPWIRSYGIRVSLIDLYLHTRFRWNRKTCGCRTEGHTYGQDIETGFIR